MIANRVSSLRETWTESEYLTRRLEYQIEALVRKRKACLVSVLDNSYSDAGNFGQPTNAYIIYVNGKVAGGEKEKKKRKQAKRRLIDGLLERGDAAGD